MCMEPVRRYWVPCIWSYKSHKWSHQLQATGCVGNWTPVLCKSTLNHWAIPPTYILFLIINLFPVCGGCSWQSCGRGPLAVDISLLPPCGSQGSKSGHQFGSKVPLPTVPILLAFAHCIISLALCTLHHLSGPLHTAPSYWPFAHCTILLTLCTLHHLAGPLHTAPSCWSFAHCTISLTLCTLHSLTCPSLFLFEEAFS